MSLPSEIPQILSSLPSEAPPQILSEVCEFCDNQPAYEVEQTTTHVCFDCRHHFAAYDEIHGRKCLNCIEYGFARKIDELEKYPGQGGKCGDHTLS